RFYFIGRDMTEARLAQESLRESERLAHDIVETALDAFVQTDETGSFLNWNSQGEQLFGWRSDEVLGKCTIDLIVAPSERERVRTGLLRFLETGPSGPLNTRRALMVIGRAGTVF